MSEAEVLRQLWKKIVSGTANPQEKVDAAALAGRQKERRYVEGLLGLLQDRDAEVRFYALQSLVLDLQESVSIVDLCWKLLRSDSDADVRRMAAACLGKIYFGSRSACVFRNLLIELKSDSQPPPAKSGVYVALFQVAGRPPLEWPGLTGPRRASRELEFDWEKIAQLQDIVESQDFGNL